MVGPVRVTGLGIVVGMIKLVFIVGVVRVFSLDDKHSAQNIHGLHNPGMDALPLWKARLPRAAL